MFRIVILIGVVLTAAAATAFEPLFNARIDYPTGSAPNSVCSADLDGDCRMDISDLTRMIDYLYGTFTPLGVGCE